MDSDRIQVLHVADRERGVVCIAHDFVFDLFIALDAFFNQYLMDRGKLQGFFHYHFQFFRIVSKAASGAA